MVSDNTSWNRLGGSNAIPHASALGIVDVCLEIQVRIVHSCARAIKINANYYYLVADATGKSPGPTNLFREEDNHTDNSITQVMEEKADQMVPLLPNLHNLNNNKFHFGLAQK
jgi:hypothetical protein